MPPAPKRRKTAPAKSTASSFFAPRRPPASSDPPLSAAIAASLIDHTPATFDPETETSLALLLSLHPNLTLSTALELLLDANGSVELASQLLTTTTTTITSPPPKNPAIQTSVSSFLSPSTSDAIPLSSSSTALQRTPSKPPKKGETLHLYTPEAAELHTPTLLIPRFLRRELANDLLRELLKEAETFPPPRRFRLFEREVESPHTAAFFLRNVEAEVRKEDEAEIEGDDAKGVDMGYYTYHTTKLPIRHFTPSMAAVTDRVEALVNERLQPRVRWRANAALVNCYRGKEQSVGWHTDEVTYLGPKAVIASVSLGVEREFRVRRARRRRKKPEDSGGGKAEEEEEEDEEDEGQGQYSIHLPHNSLLVMKGGMQEKWKHCIAPARTITPHPIAGDIRINITYRFYRDSLKPGTAPHCKCGYPATLRAVFPEKMAKGVGDEKELEQEEEQKYFWMCAATYRVDHKGDSCGFFEEGKFDEDGELIKN